MKWLQTRNEVYLRQLVSSERSTQSRRPSHCRAAGMQWPESHWKKPGRHVCSSKRQPGKRRVRFLTELWAVKRNLECSACSPQSRSSELSPQSLSWSQTQVPEMHVPSSHRNSLSEQGLGSTGYNQIEKEWNSMREIGDIFFWLVRHSRQFFSSEPSPQSLLPSHCQRMGIQRWLSHRKSPRGSQVTSAVWKMWLVTRLDYWGPQWQLKITGEPISGVFVCVKLQIKWNKKSNDAQSLTTALLVTVVDAVVGTVTTGPLRDTAVVCLAGELSLITLVPWTHWTGQEMLALYGNTWFMINKLSPSNDHI